MMVACIACWRVLRARADGHPVRHKATNRLRGSMATRRYQAPEPVCDGSNYKGDTP